MLSDHHSDEPDVSSDREDRFYALVEQAERQRRDERKKEEERE